MMFVKPCALRTVRASPARPCHDPPSPATLAFFRYLAAASALPYSQEMSPDEAQRAPGGGPGGGQGAGQGATRGRGGEAEEGRGGGTRAVWAADTAGRLGGTSSGGGAEGGQAAGHRRVGGGTSSGGGAEGGFGGGHPPAAAGRRNIIIRGGKLNASTADCGGDTRGGFSSSRSLQSSLLAQLQSLSPSSSSSSPSSSSPFSFIVLLALVGTDGGILLQLLWRCDCLLLLEPRPRRQPRRSRLLRPVCRVRD